jgi:MFS family permease
MRQAFIKSNNWLRLLLAALFGVIVWQAAALPFTSAEAEAWNRFVRPRFAALLVTPGAWSGLAYGLLAKRFIGVFRLSEFSLRLPSILAGAVYLASFARIPRRGWLLIPLAILPVSIHCFSFAGSLGISLAFCALALRFPNYTGACLGLALAAAPQFGFVPGILAAGFLAVWGFWRGMERVMVPAVAVAFIVLLIPLSHGGPPTPSVTHATSGDFAFHSAVQILRHETGARPVRIAVSPPARASLEFYRERYRQRTWLLDAPDPQYFLWVGSAPAAASTRSLAVLFEQSGVVLAR